MTPQEGNLLKITGGGRLAELDPRWVGLERDSTGGKATAIAGEVMDINRATDKHR